jgi:dTDP-4-dehydrorhamnose 3,5-epimerase
MKFSETKLSGAFLIEPELKEDERGFFARTFCVDEFLAHGLNPHLVQCNLSFNKKKGILRGMHYQAMPHAEAKLVRCTHGAIYDVIIDLRSNSPTFSNWFGVELNDKNRQMLYIPEGFAHGFQVLEDNAQVFYQMSAHFVPESARGIRWDDPFFSIEWPIKDPYTSIKDLQYPDYKT